MSTDRSTPSEPDQTLPPSDPMAPSNSVRTPSEPSAATLQPIVSKSKQPSSQGQQLVIRIGIVAVILSTLITGYVYLFPSESPEQLAARGFQAAEKDDTTTAYQISRTLRANPQYRSLGELLVAVIHVRRDQHEQALPMLIDPCKEERLAPQAFTLASECYYRLGRWGEAILAAQEALKRDENQLAARRWLAAAAYDLGAVGMAAEELLKIARLDQKDPRPHRLLGLIEKDREKYEMAVEYYRESLRRDPNAHDVQEIREELAQSLVQLHHTEEALEVLNACNESAAILNLKATCYEGLGQSDKQKEALKRGREVDPKDLSLLLASGVFAMSEGDTESAIDFLKQATSFHPHSSSAHYQLGQALERSGNKADADKEFALFKKWQAVEHEFTELHNDASADVGNVDLRVQLGVTAVRLNKIDLGESWFRAALAMDPRNTAAAQGLEEILEYRRKLEAGRK